MSNWYFLFYYFIILLFLNKHVSNVCLRIEIFFDSHLNATRPICVHAAVLVVEALQLELKVRPEHQGLVHLGRVEGKPARK